MGEIEDLSLLMGKCLTISCKPVNKRRNSSLQRTALFEQPKDFLEQYNHIYVNRFIKLQKRFESMRFDRISMVNGTAIICGLLHKKYFKIKHISDKQIDEDYLKSKVVFDQQDQAELGDESGNIKIHFDGTTIIDRGPFSSDMEVQGSVSLHNLPHGVAFAAEGFLDKSINSFLCKLISFPQLPPQPHMIPNIFKSTLSNLQMKSRVQPGDELLILVSGLTIENIKFLHQIVQGLFVPQILYEMLAKVNGVVICGGLTTQGLDTHNIKRVDHQISKLAETVDVYLMASNQDLKEPLWPSRPPSKYIFAKSGQHVERCSNPCMFNFGEVSLLGTCGENIHQMKRVCRVSDELQIMQSHLLYNHIAPSSPSTLFSAPALQDCLVLSSMPNLYFSGGMPRYATRVIQQPKQSCKLLMIPNFQQGVVLLNPRNLDTTLLKLTRY